MLKHWLRSAQTAMCFTAGAALGAAQAAVPPAIEAQLHKIGQIVQPAASAKILIANGEFDIGSPDPKHDGLTAFGAALHDELCREGPEHCPSVLVGKGPAAYVFRGPMIFRVWEVCDPRTQDVQEIRMHISTYEQDRTIYMDGRPHPSTHAVHTWMGFSTGKWDGHSRG